MDHSDILREVFGWLGLADRRGVAATHTLGRQIWDAVEADGARLRLYVGGEEDYSEEHLQHGGMVRLDPANGLLDIETLVHALSVFRRPPPTAMFVTEQPVALGGRLTFWLIVWAMIKQYCDVREVETGCLWALSVLAGGPDPGLSHPKIRYRAAGFRPVSIFYRGIDEAQGQIWHSAPPPSDRLRRLAWVERPFDGLASLSLDFVGTVLSGDGPMDAVVLRVLETCGWPREAAVAMDTRSVSPDRWKAGMRRIGRARPGAILYVLADSCRIAGGPSSDRSPGAFCDALARATPPSVVLRVLVSSCPHSAGAACGPCCGGDASFDIAQAMPHLVPDRPRFWLWQDEEPPRRQMLGTNSHSSSLQMGSQMRSCLYSLSRPFRSLKNGRKRSRPSSSQNL